MLIWKHGDTEITEEVQCQIPVFFARQGTHPIEFDGARAVPALHRIGIRKSGWAGLLSLHGWPRKILSGRRRRERLRPDVLTTLGAKVTQIRQRQVQRCLRTLWFPQQGLDAMPQELSLSCSPPPEPVRSCGVDLETQSGESLEIVLLVFLSVLCSSVFQS